MKPVLISVKSFQVHFVYFLMLSNFFCPILPILGEAISFSILFRTLRVLGFQTRDSRKINFFQLTFMIFF